MKSKVMIYCLLAFSVLALSSCKNNDDDYVDRFTGTYTMKIMPNFNVKYSGYDSYNIKADSEIVTNCVVTANDKDMTVKIDGVNGVIGNIVMTGFCDGFGMRLDDSSYDGYIRFDVNNNVDCDIKLDNPSVSSPYNGTMSWESSVSGTCELDIFGMGELLRCDVTGKISFVASEK